MDNELSKVSKILIEYFGNDVRRINHAVKVASFARNIALLEGVSEKELKIIEIGGYLHDVGIKLAEELYQSSNGKYQEELGPDIARDLLKDVGLEKDIIDRICFIIGHHHSYNKIDSIDFQILVEADFIVNIYEDELRKDAVKEIDKKIFKTDAGKLFIEKMYL